MARFGGPFLLLTFFAFYGVLSLRSLRNSYTTDANP